MTTAEEMADAIAARFGEPHTGYGEVMIEDTIRPYDKPRITAQVRSRLAERGITAIAVTISGLTRGGSVVMVTGRREETSA